MERQILPYFMLKFWFDIFKSGIEISKVSKICTLISQKATGAARFKFLQYFRISVVF